MYTLSRLGSFSVTPANSATYFDKPSTSGTMPTTGNVFRADRNGDPDRVLSYVTSANTLYLFERDDTSAWTQSFKRTSQISGYATDFDLSGNVITVGIPTFRSSLGRLESWYFDPYISGQTANTDYDGWLKITSTNSDRYHGTVAGGAFATYVAISAGKLLSYAPSLSAGYEFNLVYKGNLKLERGAMTKKVKIVETNHDCKVLGIDQDTKYRIYDLNKSAWIGLIYPSEEFDQRNSTGNPDVYDSYTTDVLMRAPSGPINQIAQLDNAGLGFKNEALNGISYYSDLTNDWEQIQEGVVIYNRPPTVGGSPTFPESYWIETSAPRALLSAVNFAYASEIPIDIVYYNFDEGKMYMDTFNLQNHLDYKYDVDGFINDSTSAAGIAVQLSGTRDYHKIGTNESVIWVSYSAKKNYVNEDALSVFPIPSGSMTEVKMIAGNSLSGEAYDYYYVERLKGVNRTNVGADHKSNVYSIEIKNSNLNEAITDTSIRSLVHRIVERAIREFAKKAAPANTQLWKIIWRGQ